MSSNIVGGEEQACLAAGDKASQPSTMDKQGWSTH